MNTQTTQLASPVSRAATMARTLRSAVATLGLLLLPKCPLCITAYLVGFGLSRSVATFAAPLVRPAAWAFILASCAGLAHGAWQRRMKRRQAADPGPPVCCCD